MNVSERVAKLRSGMEQNGVDAYIIPSADNHQSEYVGEYFKVRAYMTGFNGSAGTAVFTADKAGLWTDGRYFIQAEKQLQGSGISLYRMGEPGVPTIEEFLACELREHGVLGFDGRVVSMGDGQSYERTLADKNATFRYDLDLVNEVWTDRPALSTEPAFILEEKYAGESTASKLERIRKVMTESGAKIHIIASLDDVAWVINMRGNDVAYSPLILAYAIVKMDGMTLYIDEQKLTEEAKTLLAKASVTFRPYNDIYEDVKQLSEADAVMVDPMKINYALYNNIPAKAEKVIKPNPSILFKAVKNPIEQENTKNAHIKDGIAVTKFMHWVKTNAEKETITELSAAKKLDQFRKEQEGYLWQSFEPICAYKEHAAMMHYAPSPETDVELKPGHLFLNDTGGNYYEGSTDITRTFVLGEISNELKKHFTAVVRSMISLSKANFLYGCKGYNLDVLARGPIWDLGIDYKCGTGHGVGYMLSIHEAPTGFRWQILPAKNETQPLEEGMILTNEPGIYMEGSHGIRVENEMIVKKGECNEFGQFMYFEAITFAPIDLDGIIPEEMSGAERAYLNEYHRQVFEKIAPYLNEEEKTWLKEYTNAV